MFVMYVHSKALFNKITKVNSNSEKNLLLLADYVVMELTAKCIPIRQLEQISLTQGKSIEIFVFC